MNNELIPTSGSIPVTTGGAVAEHVGDMSVDRGAPASSGEAATLPARMSADLIRRMDLSESQVQAARSYLAQRGPHLEQEARARVEQELSDQYVEERLATDKRETTECATALRREWGSAYDRNIELIKNWLERDLGLPAAEEFYRARDVEGTALFNKSDVLHALLRLAMRSGRAGTPPPDPGAIRSARQREIEAWMGAKNGSAEYKKYWNDDKVQAEYRALSEGGNGATTGVADNAIDQRIAEIESWIGTWKYSRNEAAQSELRELYDRRERAQHNRGT